MGEIILYIWEFLQISPKDSHFPDTFLKYLTTKKYIVWNMAFFVNKSEGPIYFFLPPIYWNDRILEFNNSWFQSILSSQKWFQAKEKQEMAIKMPLNIFLKWFLWSPNFRIILTSLCRDIMFIGSRPYAQTLYVFQRSCLVSFGIFQIRNKI